MQNSRSFSQVELTNRKATVRQSWREDEARGENEVATPSPQGEEEEGEGKGGTSLPRSAGLCNHQGET